MQVQKVIDALAKDPRPHGYKSLHGPLQGLFRIDTGNYRVLYEIANKELVVLVVKIGDRKDVYKH